VLSHSTGGGKEEYGRELMLSWNLVKNRSDVKEVQGPGKARGQLLVEADRANFVAAVVMFRCWKSELPESKEFSMKTKRLLPLTAILALPAFLLLAIINVGQIPNVAHACAIAWARPNNPDLQATQTGAFAKVGAPFELETSVVVFQGESPFTLILTITIGTSVNIANCTVDPRVLLNAGGGEGGTSVHLSDITGNLSVSTTDGTVKISASNSQHPELCTQEHSRLYFFF